MKAYVQVLGDLLRVGFLGFLQSLEGHQVLIAGNILRQFLKEERMSFEVVSDLVGLLVGEGFLGFVVVGDFE